MYDVKERKKLTKLTVSKFIEQLLSLPQAAEVLICGENIFFLHIEKDKSVVCIDTEDLEDVYIEDTDTSSDDFWENRSRLEKSMGSENSAVLGKLLSQFEEQKKIIYAHYVQLVDSVIRGQIRTEKEIERIMDGLIDFGDDEHFLALYKKLCRHVYNYYPQMVGEHIRLFRLQFEENEKEES